MLKISPSNCFWRKARGVWSPAKGWCKLAELLWGIFVIAVVTSVLLVFSQQSVVLPSGKKCSWESDDWKTYRRSDPIVGLELIPGVFSGTPKNLVKTTRPELVTGPRKPVEVLPGIEEPARASFSPRNKLLDYVSFEGKDTKRVFEAFVRKYGRPTLSKLIGVFNDTKAAVPITGAVHPPGGEAFKWCTDTTDVYFYDEGERYSATIGADYIPLKR